jgi:hypothetical protein
VDAADWLELSDPPGLEQARSVHLILRLSLHGVMGAILGAHLHGPIGAIGLPMASGLARTASARQTFANVNRLGAAVQGLPQGVGRAFPLAPLSVFYGLAAQNAAADEAKKRGSQPGY